MHGTPPGTPPTPPRRTLRQAMNWRTLRYGSHASLFTVIILAVLVLLYKVILQHNQRFDVTQAKRFTLAEQSVKLVQGLQQPIKVLGFYSLGERERDTFTDLLKQYAAHSDQLSYELVDPDRQPALAQRYEVVAYNTVVVEGNGRKEKVVRAEEAALTNAILKVTRSTKKSVYFVTGHGEPLLTDNDRKGYALVKQALEEQNYIVQELVLARQPQVPDDAAAVVLAGPRQELLDPELEALSAFLQRGGHLCLMIDPETVPRLVEFVRRYGLEVGDDIVIETNALGRLVGGDYLMPVVLSYGQHAITKDIGNMMTLFPVVRSVEVAKTLPPGVNAQALASTSNESWAETDMKTLQEGRVGFDTDKDRRGPISVAAVATLKPEAAPGTAAPTEPGAPDKSSTARAARLVVFGDSEFANNSFLPASPGNSNFFLNTVSWLAEEEDMIAIRPRRGGGSGPVMLTAAQEPLIFWLPVVLWPLAVLASGAVVFARRKWQQ